MRTLVGMVLLIGGLNLHAELGVEDAWSRASPPMVETGAVYLTIVNDEQRNRRLVEARSGNAASITIHETLHENGMTRMAHRDSLPIEAGSTLRLGPNGIHLMMLNLHAPLVEGDQFDLILKFDHGEEVSVPVNVGGIGQLTPP